MRAARYAIGTDTAMMATWPTVTPRGFAPALCLQVDGPTRRRAPERCRSTRPRRTCSATPTRQPVCSRSRPTATSTAGCRTNRPPRSKNGSHRWKVGSARSARRAVSRPSSSHSPLSLGRVTTSSPGAQLYGGTRTLMEVTLARFGVETTFLPEPEPEVVAAAITPATKAVYVETIANPSGMIPDFVGLADVAHAHGVPLVVDSTMATPLPLSADRARCRHRAAFGDQVHRRPRHLARWSDHRVRAFPVGQRALSVDDRADAGVRRPDVVGQLRRVRFPHPCPLRTASRCRRHDDPVQRIPVPDGARDTRVANAPARRERPGSRPVSRCTSARRMGAVQRTARPRHGTIVRSATYPTARAPCLRSGSRAVEPPVPSSSRVCAWRHTWRTSATPAPS